MVSGARSGVDTRLTDLESRALYTHCYGHHWRRKGCSVGGAKLVKHTVCKARGKILKKTTPIISREKKSFLDELYSPKQKQKAAGDHDRDDLVGKVQRQGLGEGI